MPADICVGKFIIIGSDNGLSPDRRQAIIWTNARLLSIGPLQTYFNENLIKIHQFSLKKMPVKTSSAKWRPSCLGLNVLKALLKSQLVINDKDLFVVVLLDAGPKHCPCIFRDHFVHAPGQWETTLHRNVGSLAERLHKMMPVFLFHQLFGIMFVPRSCTTVQRITSVSYGFIPWQAIIGSIMAWCHHATR